ncbi:MAG TPA: hypothetical protein VG294_00690 [Solirubrobacteraceae bacterium]|nr:hypothetical protein [Solirubrobacteraceae bacterium]
MSAEVRPELAALAVADPPVSWAELGFAVDESSVDLGGVQVRLGEPGRGIVSWTLRGVDGGEIDGLATTTVAGAAPTVGREHPNGALAIDHVVVLTPAFDRTAAALASAGMPLRRVRDGGGFRQGFRRLGPAILELVETPGAPDGPARFWGLVVVVADLAALADRLGDGLGAVRDAVQPGRRIATLRASAGLGPALAFMDPEP